jgi:protein N-terminal methyltransferase
VLKIIKADLKFDLPLQITGGPGNQRALDCGAGIGRITKHLLQRHFIKIDLAEQNPKFLEKAKDYLQDSGKVGQLFCSGI